MYLVETTHDVMGEEFFIERRRSSNCYSVKIIQQTYCRRRSQFAFVCPKARIHNIGI